MLAYVPGEEDFIDADFNNVYDSKEVFTDLGDAYRDDNENLQFDTGEFSVPRGTSVVACPTVGIDGRAVLNSRPNTCDGQWGSVDVRKQGTIIFATSEAIITAGDLVVRISDLNDNSMPTGSLISAEKLSGSDQCTVKRAAPSVVPNTLLPIEAAIILDKCGKGDVIGVTVETPGKFATTQGFSLK